MFEYVISAFSDDFMTSAIRRFNFDCRRSPGRNSTCTVIRAREVTTARAAARPAGPLGSVHVDLPSRARSARAECARVDRVPNTLDAPRRGRERLNAVYGP
eukprot:COSAG02_NODE_24193_length_695_cov_1.280201_1_plen_101_part_00